MNLFHCLGLIWSISVLEYYGLSPPACLPRTGLAGRAPEEFRLGKHTASPITQTRAFKELYHDPNRSITTYSLEVRIKRGG